MELDIVHKVGNRISELELQNLPKELVDQLKLPTKNNLTDLILLIIEDDYKGSANINEVLIGIYKRTQVIEKRSKISTKLYRMCKSNHLQPVKGKKGVYRINY